MPFYKSVEIQGIKLLFWEITESELELQKGILLSDLDASRLKNIKTENHRKNFWAVRQLLSLQNISSSMLMYNDKGKPFLTNGQIISISHSFPMVVVALGSKSLGVDIEKMQPRIVKLAPKFTNWQSDNCLTENQQISAFTKVWTAKESLFKAAGVEGVDFKEQLILENFSIEKQQISALIIHQKKQQKYKVFWDRIGEFIWCLVSEK